MNEKELFLAALEYETQQQREAFLNEACGDDAQLLVRVQELLATHAGSLGPLDHSPVLDDVTKGQAEDDLTVAHGNTGNKASSDKVPDVPRVRYFGNYELLEEIARGGMGVVYKARQTNLNRLVALKMILAGQLASCEELDRFHVEAEAAANLDHPGIVPIYEIGEHEGQHFYSMAYIDGPSLADLLANGPLVPRAAAKMLASIAQAVSSAHESGVIHRDLKPANILLQKPASTGDPVTDPDDTSDNEKTAGGPVEWIPKVTDFGLAKTSQEDRALTATGQVLGTPGYMAPEQISGDAKTAGPTADIYALGSIFYCMLTGHPPFQAATPVDTMMQKLKEDPLSVRQVNSTIPKDLETICHKAMSRDPARRYSSCAALENDLQLWLSGRPILARPIGTAGRVVRWTKRNPLPTALIAVSLLITLIVAWSGWRTAKALSLAGQRLYANQISSANQDILSGNLNQAIWTLNDTDADYQDWEFNYLRRQCMSKPDRILTASINCWQFYFGPETAVAITREGKIINLATGESEEQLERFAMPILREESWEYARPSVGKLAIGMAPDEDRVARIADLEKRMVVASIELADSKPVSLKCSADSRHLVAVYTDEANVAWEIFEIGTCNRIASFDFENASLEAISPDGSLIAIRHTPGDKELFSVFASMTGNEKWQLDSESDLTWLGAGVATGNSDDKLQLYSGDGSLEVVGFDSFKCYRAARSDDQSRIAIALRPRSGGWRSVTEGHRILVFNRQRQQILDLPVAPGVSVHDMSLSTSGEWLTFSCGFESDTGTACVILWDIKSGKFHGSYRGRDPNPDETLHPAASYTNVSLDEASGELALIPICPGRNMMRAGFSGMQLNPGNLFRSH